MIRQITLQICLPVICHLGKSANHGKSRCLPVICQSVCRPANRQMTGPHPIGVGAICQNDLPRQWEADRVG